MLTYKWNLSVSKRAFLQTALLRQCLGTPGISKPQAEKGISLSAFRLPSFLHHTSYLVASVSCPASVGYSFYGASKPALASSHHY